MKKTKLIKAHSVKFASTILLLFLALQAIEAQVITRVLGENEKIEKYIPWYFPEKPSDRDMPPVDVQQTLLQDSIDGKILPRFGIRKEINLTKSDGTIYEFGNYKVWKLAVRSDDAKTISFKLANATLPDGAELFVYNPDTRFVVGPINNQNLHSGAINTDAVAGDYAVLEVFLPKETNEGFSLEVKDAVHGIMGYKGDDDFDTSEDCNVNTACPEGDGWENEIDAVCKIITPSGVCTGTLINNECNDLTPFILTANHCIDDPSNLSDYLFRFNYESLDCEDIEPGIYLWITFSGAVFRAGSTSTDFALLELTTPVSGANVAFAGWNRNAAPPTNNVVSIHHPSGDVKKISFNNDGIGENGDFWNVEQWDIGLVEHDSSGCALFDEGHLIIGQLQGGDVNIGCDGDGGLVDNNTYGKFDVSWDGDGTNSTRLSNWLGGVNNPMTLDGLAMPHVEGADFLCYNNSRTFTLNNPLPNYTVNWEVTPTSLFGSSTSGNGTSTDLWPASFYSKGAATITFTLENPDCGTLTFSKQFWVGKPLVTGIETPECFDPGENYVLTVISEGGDDFLWSFPTCPNGDPTVPDPECWYNYTGNSQQINVYTGQQGGHISVWVTNPCGTSSINVPIGEFCDDTPGSDLIFRQSQEERAEESSEIDDGKSKVHVYPNPANHTLNAELNQEFYIQEEEKELQLIDVSGKPFYRNTIKGNKVRINLLDVPSGVYYLKVQHLGNVSFEKVVII